jgi:hypothetical protein
MGDWNPGWSDGHKHEQHRLLQEEIELLKEEIKLLRQLLSNLPRPKYFPTTGIRVSAVAPLSPLKRIA